MIASKQYWPQEATKMLTHTIRNASPKNGAKNIQLENSVSSKI